MISIRFKRGTTAQLATLVEAAGVLSVNEETFAIHLHDGVTAGGHVFDNVSSVQTLQEQIDLLGIADVDGLEVALAAKVAVSELGAANGVAQLNPEGVVPTEQLPSYVEDVIEVSTLTALPAVGEIGKLYVLLDTNELYRWSGGQAQYYRISAVIESSDDLSEGQVNLYFTEARARNAFGAAGDLTYDPTTGVFSYAAAVPSVEGQTGTVVVTKSDVGLGNVQNFGVASEQEAQDGVVSDKFVTSALTRSLVEHMGFTDDEGSWVFRATGLPSLGLKGNWSESASGLLGLRHHSMSTINGKAYVFGGAWDIGTIRSNRLFEYDPGLNAWSELSAGPAELRFHSSVAINGRLYVFGGDSSLGGQEDSLFSYDPATDQWETLTSSPITINDHSAVAIGSKMYVYGGAGPGGAIIDRLFEYDTVTNGWTELTPGPLTLTRASAVAINGKMYVYGGHVTTHSGTSQNRLFEYDPATDQWAELSAGPTANWGAAAAMVADKMYIYGGSGTADQLFEYDPAADQWSTLDPGILATYDHAATAIDGKMYVYGGHTYTVRLFVAE